MSGRQIVVQVRYFASLREKLDCAGEKVELAEGDSLAELRRQLMCSRGEVLADGRIRCARNGEVCADDAVQLMQGDELAFFPPVTGG